MCSTCAKSEVIVEFKTKSLKLASGRLDLGWEESEWALCMHSSTFPDQAYNDGEIGA